MDTLRPSSSSTVSVIGRVTAIPLWVTCGGSGTPWPLAQSPSDVSLELGALAVQATFELSASVHRKTLRNAMRRIDGRRVHTPFFGDLEIELSSVQFSSVQN
jgi:hypothetical protein